MTWKHFLLTQTLTRLRHIGGVPFEFEASQSYVVNSRPAYLTEKDVVLKNEKQRKYHIICCRKFSSTMEKNLIINFKKDLLIRHSIKIKEM